MLDGLSAIQALVSAFSGRNKRNDFRRMSSLGLSLVFIFGDEVGHFVRNKRYIDY